MSKNKLLIVEDLDLKAKALASFVQSRYPDVTVEIKTSYNSSLKEIYMRSDNYDLILLDMSMDSFDASDGDLGGIPEPLAGQQILDGMYLRNISTPVVVVTQYNTFDGVNLKSFDSVLRTNYKDFYLGYIFFAFNTNDWKEPLLNYLNQIYA